MLVPHLTLRVCDHRHLHGLVELGIAKNKLVSLPSEIGTLTCLTDLDAYGNAIGGEMPSEIGQVAALWTMDLSHNALDYIPPELGGLTALTDLDLSHNSLCWLEDKYALEGRSSDEENKGDDGDGSDNDAFTDFTPSKPAVASDDLGEAVDGGGGGGVGGDTSDDASLSLKRTKSRRRICSRLRARCVGLALGSWCPWQLRHHTPCCLRCGLNASGTRLADA